MTMPFFSCILLGLVAYESAIKRLIGYKGKTVTFNQVDKEYLIGFIDFLNSDVNEFDSKKADQNRPKKPLSDVYKEALFARVMIALNKAEREGIILKNPGKEIDNRLKPHAKESTRCYLTLEEVKKIIETPHTPDNDEEDEAQCFGSSFRKRTVVPA